MPIIKNSDSKHVLGNAVVLDLDDLSRYAERIVSEAKAKAEGIVREAREEAERMRAAASEQGRAEGFAAGEVKGRERGERAGREEAMNELAPRIEVLLAAWESALDEFQGHRGDLLLQAREDVVRLAVEIGRRVVHRHAQIDPSVIDDQLAGTLDLLSRPSAVEIAVHPADRPLAEQVVPRLLSRLDGGNHVRLRDDASITPGGCLVRTTGGEIDARLETQMEEIARALVPGGSIETSQRQNVGTSERQDVEP